jgi:hypothetical protein
VVCGGRVNKQKGLCKVMGREPLVTACRRCENVEMNGTTRPISLESERGERGLGVAADCYVVAAATWHRQAITVPVRCSDQYQFSDAGFTVSLSCSDDGFRIKLCQVPPSRSPSHAVSLSLSPQ